MRRRAPTASSFARSIQTQPIRRAEQSRMRAERALENGLDSAWTRFRRTSVASVVLWFTVLLAGSFLSTIS